MTIDGEYQIPLPLEVLDAAIYQNLQENVRGFVEFSHENIGPGISKFELAQNELGELGEFSLIKKGDKLTALSVKGIFPRDEKKQAHFNVITKKCFQGLVNDAELWRANNACCPLWLLAIAGVRLEDLSKFMSKITVTFSVNTSPNHFAYWLGKHTEELEPSEQRDIKVFEENGRVWVLGRSSPPGRLDGHPFNPSRCAIQGTVSYPDPKPGEPERRGYSGLIDVIVFRIIPLDPNGRKTEVTVECLEVPSIKDYLRELLAEISRPSRWPEALSEILRSGIEVKQEQPVEHVAEQPSGLDAETSVPVNSPKKGGRPHFSEDIRAWEQVNIEGRNPSDVFKEWEQLVKSRNLIDSKRQFNRIKSPNWLK